MDLPPLTHKYFSRQPDKERFLRLLCLLVFLSLTFLLYYFWHPLRSAEVAYTLVSLTINNRFLALFFRVFTILGSEGFFLVLLSLIYWSVNKSLATWGLILMPLSIFVTSEIPKDISRLPRPEVRGVAVPTYTFPSGHTSGAVSVWGYLSIRLQKRWVWALAIFLALMVGLSRVMLGYHFPGDVLGGFIAGVIFLALFFELAQITLDGKWQEKLSFASLLLAAVAIPLAMSYIPATFAPRLMGYSCGAALGSLLERKYLQFSLHGSRTQHIKKALLGLFVMATIILGPETLLSINIHLLLFLQYTLATFWITYLAPLSFIKLNLTNKTH